ATFGKCSSHQGLWMNGINAMLSSIRTNGRIIRGCGSAVDAAANKGGMDAGAHMAADYVDCPGRFQESSIQTGLLHPGALKIRRAVRANGRRDVGRGAPRGAAREQAMKQETRAAAVGVTPGPDGTLTLQLTGWLDSHTIRSVWASCREAL